MLCTVSTVKETVDGLERFVSRNLACGVDHLVVFVDDADPDALAWLATRDHVTAVAAGPDWWAGNRPGQLNARQKINANLARTVLAVEPGADWLFHVDGDEVLRADRPALDALPDDATVLHAATLEAVSRESWPDHEVTHFKTMLGEDELVLLQVLGVLDKPLNEHLFHGHVKGKSGMRPAMDRWFTLHEVQDAAQQDLAPYDAAGPVAALLHYESWSGEEFVRKWTNILGSGELPAMRGRRQPTAVALRALLARGLAPDVLQAMLLRIYRQTTEDDFETLRDLGLLVELHPREGGHVPAGLPDRARRRLETLLAAFGPEDKRVLRTGETAPAAAKMLASVAGRLETAGLDRDDVRRIGAIWSGSAPSERGLSWRARRPAWPGR